MKKIVLLLLTIIMLIVPPLEVISASSGDTLINASLQFINMNGSLYETVSQSEFNRLNASNFSEYSFIRTKLETLVNLDKDTLFQ